LLLKWRPGAPGKAVLQRHKPMVVFQRGKRSTGFDEVTPKADQLDLAVSR
jgi:hypothetical protein